MPTPNLQTLWLDYYSISFWIRNKRNENPPVLQNKAIICRQMSKDMDVLLGSQPVRGTIIDVNRDFIFPKNYKFRVILATRINEWKCFIFNRIHSI